MEYKYHPKTKEELLDAIKTEIILQGNGADLNCIDTSAITDMSSIFKNSSHFNGDISKWNVSKVSNMAYMFANSQFNGYISKWNVSNVKDMSGMFAYSQFNGDISNWDVSNVVNMAYMFAESKFNGNISRWNVSNVTNMFCMFSSSQFNGDISKWDVRNVRWMKDIFLDSKFDGDISNWNIDNVIDDRSSVLEYGIFREYSENGENSDETGLRYSGKGESSLVSCVEDSKPGKKEEEENTVFDKLKNAFGKIFG